MEERRDNHTINVIIDALEKGKYSMQPFKQD